MSGLNWITSDVMKAQNAFTATIFYEDNNIEGGTL